MQIVDGILQRGEMNSNARGGTELIAERLLANLDKTALEGVQIVFTRQAFPLIDDKIRIYYCHDLPGDPACDVLAKGGWVNYDVIVFVSYWQRDMFMGHYNIPFSRCTVIHNGVDPIPYHVKPEGPITLGYWSTPHRGLDILVPVFDVLLSEGKYDIELDVFSSFELYGWKERDKQFQTLFDYIKQHPKIRYHGTVANSDLRDHLRNIHIMAYPSIWAETSCLSLMEAMTAGIDCVHSNYGALPETSANLTWLYDMHEDKIKHANIFASTLKLAIEQIRSQETAQRLKLQKLYADVFYSTGAFVSQWRSLLKTFEHTTPTPTKRDEYFTINTQV